MIGPVPNARMLDIKRDNAFVVKKIFDSTADLLLIISKRWVLGNFASLDLPLIGSVVTIEWKYASDVNTIDVYGWSSCTAPMGGFTASESGGMVKFTGMFYTTGCICHDGLPLENPAVFNNQIGVVNDIAKLLKEHYIGKLRATVFLEEVHDDYRWTLCSIEEYLKKENEEGLDKRLPYKGVVGSVKQGRLHSTHYITSRYFPVDVRFFANNVANPETVWDLLGREVYFAASKNRGKGVAAYVVGEINEVTPVRFRTIKYGSYFKVDDVVEYIGCTDEHGNTIVWSEQFEFMVDKYRMFSGLVYGVYSIQAIRHFKLGEFPRWKVTEVFRLIEAIDEDSMHASRCLDRVLSFDQRTCSTSRYQKRKTNSEQDPERTMRTCLHRCLESVKVRASIKQADPAFFKYLVDALMHV